MSKTGVILATMNLQLPTVMKKIILLLALISFAVINIRAATNFVILGDDFQTKINASAPGDTLVVQAGVYPGNLNFNKPLTVLRSGTNQIQFLGTVQITGAGNSSFQFSQFGGAVTIQATGTVSFAQSRFLAPFNSSAASLLMSYVTSSSSFTADLSVGSGTNFQAYDSSLYYMALIGGKTLMKRCTITAEGSPTLTLSSNAAFEGLRVTNYGYFNATASVGSGTPFVAVQCYFPYPVTLSGYKVWLGYSSLGNPFYGSALRQTNCDSVMVGNNVYSQGGDALVYCQGGTLKAYNNYISATLYNGLAPNYGMWLRSNTSEVINNTIYMATTTYPGLGILITDAVGSHNFRANIVFVGNNAGYFCTEAINSTVNSSFCNLFPPNRVGNFSPLVNCQFVDPLIESPNGLSPVSPCIDAGPPDAIFNDRNGTRNDIGRTGGPYWNPANYTNDNPIVFFLTGSPQTVLKGVQTNILVNVGASSGH